MINSKLLAEVIRGDTVESVHRGHVIVIDGKGHTVVSLGDPSTVTFYRSSAKPFQTIPFITSGAADAFGFPEEEVAMAIASHSGEKIHVKLVGRMLERIGLSESDLRCGSHAPFNTAESERMIRAGEPPTQLHNNCSGKHAAMLALAKHIGADIDDYETAGHRVQSRVLRCVAEFTELPEQDIAVAIDGCAAPNFALPLSAMARSFINLLSPSKFHESVQKACFRVVSAMVAHPELIGGNERLDTLLMRSAPGRLVSKVGADGVWLCGVLPCDNWPAGLAIALKVEDGDDMIGRPVIAVNILRQLGVLTEQDLPDLAPMPVRNRKGDIVGRVQASFSI